MLVTSGLVFFFYDDGNKLKEQLIVKAMSHTHDPWPHK